MNIHERVGYLPDGDAGSRERYPPIPSTHRRSAEIWPWCVRWWFRCRDRPPWWDGSIVSGRARAASSGCWGAMQHPSDSRNTSLAFPGTVMKITISPANLYRAFKPPMKTNAGGRRCEGAPARWHGKSLATRRGSRSRLEPSPRLLPDCTADCHERLRMPRLHARSPASSRPSVTTPRARALGAAVLHDAETCPGLGKSFQAATGRRGRDDAGSRSKAGYFCSSSHEPLYPERWRSDGGFFEAAMFQTLCCPLSVNQAKLTCLLFTVCGKVESGVRSQWSGWLLTLT